MQIHMYALLQGSCKPTKKCVMQMKETRKNRRVHKNVIDGRRAFTESVWQSSMIGLLRTSSQ